MFISLVSGSSGNAALISDGKTNLLADCGLSCKKLEQALKKVNMTPADLSAVLITHEHSDHIKGAGTVARKYNLPIYATLKTHETMQIGYINETNIKYVLPDVRPFSIPHDAVDPVGYNFFFGEKKLSLATDIGKMNRCIFDRLKGSIAVLLESNHDTEMLKNGCYPMHLKRRILGDFGHLSNVAAAQTVLELLKNGTEHIMLGHLSNENNTPTIAYTETESLLAQNGASVGRDLQLTVAHRYEVSNFR